MKKVFRKISIKLKLTAGFGIIVLIMLLTGVRELIVLRNLETKRNRITRIVNSTDFIKESKFIISSELDFLSEISSFETKKEVENIIQNYKKSNNNIETIFLKLFQNLKLNKKYKFNVKSKLVKDSLNIIRKTYNIDIKNNFTEIFNKKNNVIDIDNYYKEYITIGKADTIENEYYTDLISKEQLLSNLQDEIFLLETHIRLTAKQLITQLASIENKTKEITKQIESTTLGIFQTNLNRTFIYIFSIILISILISILITQSIIRPISNLQLHLDILTKGVHPKEIEIKSDDEIGNMGKSLNLLVDGLKKTSDFSIEIGKRNFTSNYKPLSKEDVLGNSLLSMRDSLKAAIEDEDKRKVEDLQRNRSSEGLALFGDILRKHTENISDLSDEIISSLVKFMKANQGGVFILNDTNKNDTYLELLGAYAYNRKKYLDKKIRIGEGLVGAVALEKYTVYMTDIPNEYIEIESGIGSSNPKSILIVPLKIDQEILGIIELASFNEFEEYEIELVEKIADSIASTISTARINTRTANLLEESNRNSAKMQEQEEEMRQNIEELKATQDESDKREEELRQELSKLIKLHSDLENSSLKERDEVKNLRIINKEQLVKLEENEIINNILLDNDLHGIVIFNQSLEIEAFNKAAINQLEYERKNILGKKIDYILPDDIKESLKKDQNYLIEEFMTEGKEGVLKSGNNGEIPVYYSFRKFDFRGNDKYLMILKNITAEKDTETQRLELSENIIAKEFEYQMKIEQLERLLKQNNIAIVEEKQKELIRWTDELSINVDIIDQQHKKWIDIINEFYFTFNKGKNKEELKDSFNELTDYTDYHFGFEEKYMSEFGFAEYDSHLENHKIFLQKIVEYKEEFMKGNTDVVYKALPFLRTWVRDHIIEEDIKYSPVFIKNGLT